LWKERSERCNCIDRAKCLLLGETRKPLSNVCVLDGDNSASSSLAPCE
jgi:hypothetical protein